MLSIEYSEEIYCITEVLHIIHNIVNGVASTYNRKITIVERTLYKLLWTVSAQQA